MTLTLGAPEPYLKTHYLPPHLRKLLEENPPLKHVPKSKKLARAWERVHQDPMRPWKPARLTVRKSRKGKAPLPPEIKAKLERQKARKKAKAERRKEKARLRSLAAVTSQ